MKAFYVLISGCVNTGLYVNKVFKISKKCQNRSSLL